METLFYLSILTMLLIFFTVYIIYKTKDLHDDVPLLQADIMMIISTVTGSIGILNLILNYGLKVPSGFIDNSGFLVNTLLVWV